MTEIADLTFNVVAFAEVMGMLWKRLNDSGKNWRHVYKVPSPDATQSTLFFFIDIPLFTPDLAHRCPRKPIQSPTTQHPSYLHMISVTQLILSIPLFLLYPLCS